MARLKQRDSVVLADLLAEVVSRRLDEIPVELELQARPRVAGAARALALAVDNLIDNAVTASPPGGTVLIRLGADDRSALIDVLDEGAGVPPIARERLFEPFCTTQPNAAGLGLAATQAIARAHGGSLELHDAPTTFRLRLPSA